MIARSLLKEPLLHFFVIGGVLFGLYSLVNRAQMSSDDVGGGGVYVGETEILAIKARWKNQWGREPTRSELTDLVNDYVREEVLYRQAIVMGLDRDDTIVRRRMAQKMTFLIEGMAVEQSPDQKTLRSWFAENRVRYQQPAAVSFRHIYFSADRRGAAAVSDAEAIVNRLNGIGGNAELVAASGDRFMLKDSYTAITEPELRHLFGAEFAAAVFALEAGQWQGPIPSSFGQHLVLVEKHRESMPINFEQVANRVESDWLQQKEKAANTSALQELLDEFQVEIADEVKVQCDASRLHGAGAIR